MNLQENIYDKIREMFGDVYNNLSVLEEQIDVDLQMEYYEYSKNNNPKLSPEEIINRKDTIFHTDTPLEDEKNLLVQLASIESIEAYRTIEKYLNNPDSRLYDWARMAFHESRMLLESKLLDENQIMISTGLGGRGLKLRYFTVFFTFNGTNLNKLKQKVIRDETRYILKKFNAEPEILEFDNNIATVLSLIPITIPVQDIFSGIIDECNELGCSLDENYIITNIRILTLPEIREFISNYHAGILE